MICSVRLEYVISNKKGERGGETAAAATPTKAEKDRQTQAGTFYDSRVTFICLSSDMLIISNTTQQAWREALRGGGTAMLCDKVRKDRILSTCPGLFIFCGIKV